jgi:predicted PhzF superfamily epimerase YddE/YHI9
MTRLHVLKVFVGPHGRGGNPLGVLVDGRSVPDVERQRLAARLGFSETVFVDDPETGDIRIFTPARELRFAGHPTVGTGWLLRKLGHGTSVLRPPAGDVATWDADGLAHIRARASWVHAIDFQQLSTAAEVDALTGAPPDRESWYPWAWIDEAAGTLRSRYFVR